MKDEKKEILDYFKDESCYFKQACDVIIGADERIVVKEDMNELLDYITNLQTIEQQYSIILSENAELENKITNLQEENKRLKEENKRIFSKVNDDELLISNAMNYAEAQDYKSRCEKAIDKISKLKPFIPNEIPSWLDELENILNGGDE